MRRSFFVSPLYKVLFLLLLLAWITACSQSGASNEVGNPNLVLAVSAPDGAPVAGAKVNISLQQQWYKSPQAAFIYSEITDEKGEILLPAEAQESAVFAEIVRETDIQVVRLQPQNAPQNITLQKTSEQKFENHLSGKESKVILEGGQTALFTTGSSREYSVNLAEQQRLFLLEKDQVQFVGSQNTMQLKSCYPPEFVDPENTLHVDPFVDVTSGSLLSLSGTYDGNKNDSVYLSDGNIAQSTLTEEGVWKTVFPLAEEWQYLTVEAQGATPVCALVEKTEHIENRALVPVWISTPDYDTFQGGEWLMLSSGIGAQRFLTGLQLLQSLSGTLMYQAVEGNSFRIASKEEAENLLPVLKKNAGSEYGDVEIKMLYEGIKIVLSEAADDLCCLGEELPVNLLAMLKELFGSTKYMAVAIFAPSYWNGLVEERGFSFTHGDGGVLGNSLPMWSWPQTYEELPSVLADQEVLSSESLYLGDWERKTKAGVMGGSLGTLLTQIFCATGLSCSSAEEEELLSRFSNLDYFWDASQNDLPELTKEEGGKLVKSGWYNR